MFLFMQETAYDMPIDYCISDVCSSDLTYSGNLQNLQAVSSRPEHVFVQSDIGDRAVLSQLLAQHRPRAVVNFAAESHVDRSISVPAAFIETDRKSAV